MRLDRTNQRGATMCKDHTGEDFNPNECEACALEEAAEMADWQQLYEGERQAGLFPDKEVSPLPDPRTPEYWGL